MNFDLDRSTTHRGRATPGRKVWGKHARHTLALLAFTAVAPLTSALASDAGDTYARGLESYDTGHYLEAVHHFRGAAELGDERAPEVLALMYRFGEKLYGDGLRSDRAEAARWVAIAVERRRVALVQTAGISDR